MNKKILIPAIALGLIVASGAGWAATKAANGLGNQNMAQTLSEKLGVDQSKVTGALDQMHEERQAERQKEISTNLDKAVSDGAITAEQKEALSNKQAEMQKDREQHRDEMQQWLKDNGIDQTKIRQYLGNGNGNGMGRGGMGQSDIAE